MSGHNTVGFGFQADIVNTASLGHLLTGRILKAMSDGNVDFYAVAASIALGKSIPVQKSLESTVHKHIASRSSFRSVFNNILSIGWGHSEVAIEMSRTQAGTNALLLIGAISTGGWTYFQAAQCLSELLSLNGCDGDKLPNVDVLKGLVEYLAPFTFDLGFSKVLEHINTVVERALHGHGRDRDRDAREDTMFRLQWAELGNAPMLAGAIKQLILTAERRERIYMILKKHGSWLPAFASHILGMEVELLYAGHEDQEDPRIYGDSVIWACAGDQGSVIFELGNRPSRPISLCRTTAPGIQIVDSQGDYGRLQIDYLLQDAMQAQVSRWPAIGDDLFEGICDAIARLSWTLLKRIRLNGYYRVIGRHRINGDFDSLLALKETLSSMGIPEPSQGVIGLPFSSISHREFGSHVPNALPWLDAQYTHALESCCFAGCLHLDPDSCYYFIASNIIYNSATSAVALMQCIFDASQIRVNLAPLDKYYRPKFGWTHLCTKILHDRIVTGEDRAFSIEYSAVLEHLHHILSHSTRSLDIQLGNIGFSVGAYTVFYTGIMQHDSYDALGRTISIMPGRASVNGCLRNFICEASYPPNVMFHPHGWGPSTLAAGCFVEPHCQPSDSHVFLDASLSEEAIRLTFRVGQVASEAKGISLSCAIGALLIDWTIPKCPHDRNTPFKANKDMEILIAGFDQSDATVMDRNGLILFALHGAKLPQLLTCAFYSRETDITKILQFSACLKCCIEIARKIGRASCIIMGD